MWIQVASFDCAGAPLPPGSPASEAPSPQARNALLNEISTAAGFGPDRDRNMERVAPVIVALVGMEEKSNAINPRRKRLAPVFPSKR